MVAPAGKLEGKDTRHRGAERGRTGDLGYNLLRFFVKVINWQTQEMTMTNGCGVSIVRDPAQAAPPQHRMHPDNAESLGITT
ncbi:hypothetical protein T05_11134 [Trichinella murrelli]|uniref:Uncharacterized protein n=1 Tax=Trichinella murrelli TaxID=144512 RepID=A0A0V0T8P5_9BILA|nr:hypothetical protein T05_11134 [Trichinella murrelli]